jgi:EPS-associated MarR family transcriptional regulator
MPNRQALLQEDMHYRVLRLLHEQPDVSQRQIAGKLGISLGAAHYCLIALIERGLVKVGNFRSSRNKLGYAYLLTPAGIREKADLTSSFLQRKLVEYEALQREIGLLQLEVNLQHQGGQPGHAPLSPSPSPARGEGSKTPDPGN